MFCKYCGKENKDDVKFCGGCGRKISDINTYDNAQSVNKKTFAGKGLYIGITAMAFIVVILMICIGGMLIKTGEGKNEVSKEKAEHESYESNSGESGIGALVNSLIPKDDEEALFDVVAPKDDKEDVSEAELKKLEVKYDALLSYDEDAMDRFNHADSITKEDMEKMVQETIIKCQEENIAIALEEKALLMGAIGVNVPDNFAINTQGWDEYTVYLQDTITDGLFAQIGGDDTKAAFDMAVDAYGWIEEEAEFANGDITIMIDDAIQTGIDGAIATLNQKAYDMALKSLDEITGGLAGVAVGLAQAGSVEEYLEGEADKKLGGLIGTYKEVMDYDTTPYAFYSGVSNNVNACSQKMQKFLEKDTVKDTDIEDMMYYYSQFGTQLNTISSYEWKPTYSKMEMLYKQFVSNTVMLNKLGQIDFEKGYEIFADLEGASDTETQQHERIELSDDPATRYAQLNEEIEKLEAEYNNYLEKNREWRTENEKYIDQFGEVRKKTDDIVRFTVDTFKAEYNMSAVGTAQDRSKLNYAIEKFSKYTPWGVSIGLLAAMATEDGNKLYEVMARSSKQYTKGMEIATTNLHNSMEQLNGELEFYASMMPYGHYTDDYNKTIMLNFIQQGEPISVDDTLEDVYKDLYCYYSTLSVLKSIYNLSGTSTSNISGQMTKLEDIINKSDYSMDEISQLVSDEELAECLVPMLAAATNIMQDMTNNRIYIDSVHGMYKYSYLGKIHRVQFSDGSCYIFPDLKPGFFFLGGRFIGYNDKYFYKGRYMGKDASFDPQEIVSMAEDVKNEYDDGFHLSDSTVDKMDAVKRALE